MGIYHSVMPAILAAGLCAFSMGACSSAQKPVTEEKPAAEAAAAQNTEKPAAEAAAAQNAEKPAAEAAAAQNAEAAAQPERNEADFAKLLKPDALKETAPEVFTVIAKTTKGDVKIELHRDWSPNGVDRFYNLVKNGFFTDIAMFRMVRGFVVQFGIHGSPLISEAWREAIIPDDPVRESNVRGTLTFATAGRDTRTTQLFINLGNNASLDGMGFSPIGKIVEGMDVIDSLNFEYAERPNQGHIQMNGNAYLKAQFPNLDYILSMTVE